MNVFNSMIFFGITLLVVGIFVSWYAFGMSENCDANQDVAALNPCISTPWNLIGLYLLPGIVLISSAIFLKKKIS